MHRFSVLLSPPPGFQLRGFKGFPSYSIVMETLESEDPDLVAVRRSGRIQTDFSVRPIKMEGESLTLDVTAFTEEVALALSSAILEGAIRTRWGDFEILRVRMEEIDSDAILSSSRPIRKFSVKFETPTFFRPKGGVRGGIFIPIPLPDRMLISLHRTWNRYLGPMEDEMEREDFHRWLESWGVVISGHNVRTIKVNDGDKFAVGFVGWANFSANPAYEDPGYLRKVDALLRFGEIANVGGLRSKGFGVISYGKGGSGRTRKMRAVVQHTAAIE